ncbi:MAG: threonylcarbamoyl-AMP synthase [Chloroflexi bacterium]|nr:threonylcarbamoyl-AMP synthase [Chloroflexota bacterium]
MDSSERNSILDAVSCLLRGGIVAFPTDTLYGLGADVFNERAVERVFVAKGRPGEMALPILLADTRDMSLVARDIPDIAWALAERFFPGALSLVLRKASRVPDLLSGGAETVALRVPDHPVPRRLARALGHPITGTSANRSGSAPARTAEEVVEQLGDNVDMVIDGGPIHAGIPSTVLDVSNGIPYIVRQGGVSQAEIEAVCGKSVEVRR